MSINVGTAVAYLDLDRSKFEQGIKKSEQSMQGLEKLGGTFSKIGGAMTAGITVPVLGMGVAMTKFSMDTEQSMAQVNSILKLSQKDFSEYSATLKDGANEIGLAYDKYADSAYNAISAGVKQADVTSFLTQTNKLAKGGLTDLAKATDVLTTIQNAYGLEQKDLAHVSDVLINTQNLGENFAPSYRNVA